MCIHKNEIEQTSPGENGAAEWGGGKTGDNRWVNVVRVQYMEYL